MKVIYKYKLDVNHKTNSAVLELPINCEIIDIQNNKNNLFLWILATPEQKLEERKFHLIGTGEEYDDSKNEYIGTVYAENYVIHIIEEIN
jgi:hypothetical protein